MDVDEDEDDQVQHRMRTFLSLEREISRIAAEEGDVSIPAYLPMPNRHGRSTGDADADGNGPNAAPAVRRVNRFLAYPVPAQQAQSQSGQGEWAQPDGAQHDGSLGSPSYTLSPDAHQPDRETARRRRRPESQLGTFGEVEAAIELAESAPASLGEGGGMRAATNPQACTPSRLLSRPIGARTDLTMLPSPASTPRHFALGGSVHSPVGDADEATRIECGDGWRRVAAPCALSGFPPMALAEDNANGGEEGDAAVRTEWGDGWRRVE
jgi:hypothetical protein